MLCLFIVHTLLDLFIYFVINLLVELLYHTFCKIIILFIYQFKICIYRPFFLLSKSVGLVGGGTRLCHILYFPTDVIFKTPLCSMDKGNINLNIPVQPTCAN